MQFSTVVILLGAALFLVLVFQVEETQSIYPYTIRGFVADVRHQPLRFIGGLFFKKAFLLKKLKLKWKLKKKFVLKKLLKKLFLSRLLGRKRRAIRFPDDNGGSIGGSSLSSSSSGASSSFVGSLGSSPSHSLQLHHHGSGSSSSPVEARTTFFDDESYDEFQSIGLGQQELDMLRQLPENLQYEYRQEMQELETSASEPREADIMEYLTATNEFDTDHCIAKGICEVMARGNVTSNRFEHLLLDYYNEEPVTRKDPSGSAAYVYDYAAFLGKSRQDSRACASYFPKCPEPTTELTGFMNEIFSSEMCDPPVTNELR